MPKRPCPDEDSYQPIKKQQTSKSKARKIHSTSSERTLQLLYQGAAKTDNAPQGAKAKGACFSCALVIPPQKSCSYCEESLCVHCTNFCYKCKDGFCPNCSFLTYDHNESVCYSCYS